MDGAASGIPCIIMSTPVQERHVFTGTRRENNQGNGDPMSEELKELGFVCLNIIKAERGCDCSLPTH